MKPAQAALVLGGRLWRRITRAAAGTMPKGLYARALLIIILPMVILQSAIALVFMERHWQLVTFRLSEAVTQDIAALIDIHRDFGAFDPDSSKLEQIAARPAQSRSGGAAGGAAAAGFAQTVFLAGRPRHVVARSQG